MPEIPIGPLVRPIQLLAISRSTSAKHSVTITKNGPRSRSVMAPIKRPNSAATTAAAIAAKWNGSAKRVDSSATV